MPRYAMTGIITSLPSERKGIFTLTQPSPSREREIKEGLS